MTLTPLFLMTVALLIGVSDASAQSKKVRPPVAGDGKYYALPDDTIVPQEFYIERPTLNNAGFEWYVSGDDNHNAVVTVRFREVGEAEWQEGLPLLRIQNEKIWGHEQRDVYETPNMFAGSVFGLKPGTTYKCEFTMSDPDGLIGVAKNTERVTTRSLPEPYEHGKVYHVYPLGLDFHGTYVLTQDGTAERPITIKAAGDGEVIFDGEGNYRLFDVMAADHHYFEGLTIVNTEIGQEKHGVMLATSPSTGKLIGLQKRVVPWRPLKSGTTSPCGKNDTQK